MVDPIFCLNSDLMDEPDSKVARLDIPGLLIL
jgi:hypothetical protein